MSKRSETGSMILPLVISTVGGVLFTMLFVNLVHYVGATNMVEQAARQVSRCLTATDANCVDYNFSPNATDFSWYGHTTDAVVADEFDRYNYRAALTQLDWSVHYQTYLQHEIEPILNFPSNTVNVYEFENRQSSGQYFAARLQQSAQEIIVNWRPRFTPNFLSFDEALERSQQDNNTWVPYRKLSNQIAQTQAQQIADIWIPDSGTMRIPSGSTRRFATDMVTNSAVNNQGMIKIPFLENANSDSKCVGGCQINAVKKGHWSEVANIAIKVDGMLAGVDGRRFLPLWGHGGGQSGLEVIVFDQFKNEIYRKNLGGRAAPNSTLSGNANHWFNMWIRGPKGSHGGDESNRRYEDITVPRGGYFKVASWLTADNTAGPIDARVRIRVYYDDYTSETKIGPIVSKSCPNKYIRQKPPIEKNIIDDKDCPFTLADCGFDQNKQWINSKCSVVDFRLDGYSCNSNDVYSFLFDESISTAPTQRGQGAICSDTEMPSGNLEPVNGIPYCGWEKVNRDPIKTIKVGSLPASCAKQSNIENNISKYSYSQQLALKDKSYAKPLENIKIKEINNNIASLNQPKGFPEFKPISPEDTWWEEKEIAVPASNSLHPKKPGLWRFSWTSNPTLVQDSFNVSLQGSSYLRTDNNNSPPFSFLISENGKKIPNEHYPNINYPNISTYDAVLLNLTVDKKEQMVTDVYPFVNQPEIKVCINANPIDSEDSWRDIYRAYIREANPNHPAADPYVALDAILPKFVDSITLSSYEQNLEQYSTSILPCTDKRVTVLNHITETHLLGVYSNLQYPNGPASCADGSYSECTKQIVVNNNLSELHPQLTTDELQAKSLGYSILKRFDSKANINCDRPSCVSINIDTDSSQFASVAVDYYMPINFPLSTILGTDSILVKTSKSEPIEIQLTGKINN
jgi:hypothetical protein